jgi:nucleotide-binding universal stress UspA family protein
MNTIVVGVDGSGASVDALRFAIREARLHHAGVKAVNAWHVPPSAYGSGFAPTVVDFDAFPKLAKEAVDKAIAEAGAAGGDVEVRSEVAQGQPADVLCEAAKGADLLVVGSRGLGGFRGLVLGSVSQQCAHHAPCPIVIVPPSAHAADPVGVD